MNEEKQDQSDSILTEEEYNLLISFLSSKYYAPYARLVKIRMLAAESGLVSVDPFKEPTVMARYQGIRIGLWEPEAIIREEIERRKTEEDKDTKKVGK